MMIRTIGSLFAGIGGLELGLERALGARTLWQVEKDPHCRAVLAHHWPEAERHEDVCNVGVNNLRPVDLLCGGFPCQDVSSAGKRAGLSGTRSGLWYEFARIIDELRPRYVIIENVASGASKWVDPVRGDLERLGYESLPVPLSAADVGAPHQRGRIFIVAHANREQLRQQPRGGLVGLANRGTPSPPWRSGGYCAGHANRDRQPTVPEHAAVAQLSRLAADSPAWSAAPEFRGMDDGLSVRLDHASRRQNQTE